MYIATDEKDKNFFEPFREHYNIVFLDDFRHVIPDVNTNYYGMIDQLVSFKSRVFYGTWWSKLSGYVNCMRGYYITKHKLDGYKDGTMNSFYFTPGVSFCCHFHAYDCICLKPDLSDLTAVASLLSPSTFTLP